VIGRRNLPLPLSLYGHAQVAAQGLEGEGLCTSLKFSSARWERQS
jgi:hypothetical protein